MSQTSKTRGSHDSARTPHENGPVRRNPVTSTFKIFLEDQRHLFMNVIGIVVVMGLVIVPAMYAWFNIAASWDPYGNTNQLKVAVANEDKGYQSDLIPVPINGGNNVESSLRANTKLDWQFVSHDEAVDGVSSGRYYAAIVIPENFSSMMMTLLSSNAQQAKIEYYINEKSNAIAPRITASAADTIVTQISSTFSETIASIALNLADNINSYATSDEGKAYVTTMVNRLNTVADGLDSAGNQLSSYAALLSASQGLVDSAKNIMSSNASGSDDVRKSLEQTVSQMRSLSSAAKSSASSVSVALDSSAKSLDTVLSQLDSLTSSVSQPTGSLSSRIDTLGTVVSSSAQRYQSLVEALNQVKDQVNSSALSQEAKTRITTTIDSITTQLNQVSSDITTIGADISAASQDVEKAKTVIDNQKSEMKKQIDAVKTTLANVKATYNRDIQPQLNRLASQLGTTAQRAQNASGSVRRIMNRMEKSGANASSTMTSVIAAMNDTHTSLSSAANSMRELATKLNDGVNSGTAELSSLLGENRSAAKLAAELSSPVKLTRHAVFAVENYGSAMAGFYTILAIWVGTVFLVSMMKISVSDRQKARVLGLSSVEEIYTYLPKHSGPETVGNASRFGLGFDAEYWGRYLTFLLISLFQSTLIVMGDLWYLGVQNVDPLRMFLVAWVASLVFSTLMYALTLSLGAVGKAIAVILMVMQIAGSGGTFPVQLLPEFFQRVYPLLPFPYGMNAMHAAIAGSYHNEYWISLGQFALFLIPGLFIGLVIARPLARSNWLMEQLSKTGVYGE
ncbi:YhgE/Pip domain-containing protein [Alloscardovia theropitheci]|uniref:YhgE/Pip domain-containing protein n=1 Tax=Alloscardovia theropitheci TaxID=2496842 RepID=A0A4R0R046_9BIFI|nr:YhgE/Pip domain-containing protein [Alloscardovia theropitheci]TCD54356.1 YhgE/Pip domain-containing protein [Alloscardovia theropitheci]